MELGSEYSLNLSALSKTSDNLFSYLSDIKHSFYYDSGRSALRMLVSLLNKDYKVFLPEYICESVINCFDRQYVHFYRINNDFSIDTDDLKNKLETFALTAPYNPNPIHTVIFLMHYFGAVQSQESLSQIKELAEKYNCLIIEDTTHSIFSSKMTIGDYAVCSIRKWFPISKGGVLYSNTAPIGLPTYSPEPNADNEKVTGLILKDLYIKNKLDCNELYRKIFKDYESRIDNQQIIYSISDLDRYIVECINIPRLVQRRQNNYLYVKSVIKVNGIIPTVIIKDNECPFSFPIRVPDRDDFRQYLIQNNIYCAVHWPTDNICPNERPKANANSQELISLPIDQRYGPNELNYMIDVITKYGGKLSF